MGRRATVVVWLSLLLASSSVLILIPASADGLVVPGWDYYNTSSFAARNGATCVNASTSSEDSHNARWTFFAVPEGTPPAGGWPVPGGRQSHSPTSASFCVAQAETRARAMV